MEMKKESKENLTLNQVDEILIKVVENPITGELIFLVRNISEKYSGGFQKAFTTKNIVIDGVELITSR